MEEVKKLMENELGKILRVTVIKDRDELELTQSQFASALVMGLRGYQKIEGGENDCCALTTFLIIAHQKDRNAYIDSICEKLSRVYKNELVLR